MIYYVAIPYAGASITSADPFVKPSACDAPLSKDAPAVLRNEWARTPMSKKQPEPYVSSTEYRWWGWASSADDAVRQARAVMPEALARV